MPHLGAVFSQCEKALSSDHVQSKADLNIHSHLLHCFPFSHSGHDRLGLVRERAGPMAEAVEVVKTARRARGADLRSAPVLWLFLALVTCHSTLLFGQRFSHVQGAMVQVTSAWTSSPFTLTLASNPAQGDLVVA